MTRWLDEDEQRAWLAYLRATTRLAAALDSQLVRDAGFPHAYYAILARLSAAPDRTMRMTDLATEVNASPSRLSHAVAKLEDKGWVTRSQCPDDRRGTFATLTDEGFRVLEQHAPGHVETVRSCLLDPISPQQVAQLERICTAVAEHIERSGPSRGGNVAAADVTATKQG